MIQPTETGEILNNKNSPLQYRLYLSSYNRSCSGTEPTMIISHGFGGSQDSDYIPPIVTNVVAKGYNAITYNFRGATTFDDGRPPQVDTKDLTPFAGLNDLKAIVNFAENHTALNPKRIILTGVSYGALISVLVGSGQLIPTVNSALSSLFFPSGREIEGTPENIEAVIGISTVLDMTKTQAHGGPSARDKYNCMTKGYTTRVIDNEACKISAFVPVHSKMIDIEKNAKSMTCQVHLIHGKKDNYNGYQSMLEFRDNFQHGNCEVHLIEGAQHKIVEPHFSETMVCMNDILDKISRPHLKVA